MTILIGNDNEFGLSRSSDQGNNSRYGNADPADMMHEISYNIRAQGCVGIEDQSMD